jgi:glutaredoxin
VAGRRVVMYSRRSCHLCDEARAVIVAEQERSDFTFDEVFVEDEELERAYGLRVPVVLVDGVEEFEFSVDAARLHGLLQG